MSILRDYFESLVQDAADNGASRDDWEGALDSVFGTPKSITVHPRFATLEWVCNNDDEHEGADDQVIAHQPLSDIEDSGTATCPQCGEDMELVSVTVES